MTTGARGRQRNFSVRPYRSALLNAVHVAAWVAVLANFLVGVYLLLSHTWLVGFGADQSVVREVYIFNPHWNPGEWPWSMWPVLLGCAVLLGWSILQVMNRRLGLRVQPFVYLVWSGCVFLYLPLHMTERLQLTPAGLSYRWGFVRYEQVVAYRWEQPYIVQQQQAATGGTTRGYLTPAYYGLLTLTIRSSSLLPLFPHTLQWPIFSSDEGVVDTVLRRYMPGRGNRPPGPRVIVR